MSRTSFIDITPSVLRWAIDQSGMSPDDLATALKVSTREINEWCSGSSRPTLTLFHKLADKLKRPEATFLLPAPPSGGAVDMKFRAPPTARRKTLNPRELRWIREVRRLHETLEWLADQLGFTANNLPRADTHSDPSKVAAATRRTVGIEPATQGAWKTEYEAFRSWRAALEELGVLIFTLPLGEESCRGFSMWGRNISVIVVNTSWNVCARTFSAFHELGHIIRQSNSACLGAGSYSPVVLRDLREERWCEEFAAAFLMPWTATADCLKNRCGFHGEEVDDLEVVKCVSRYFKVSLRAATLRLIKAGVAAEELYSQIPAKADAKPDGGGGSGRDRGQIREDTLGRRAIDLFVTAVDRDILTRYDVMGYLDATETDFERWETTPEHGAHTHGR
jgi:Zn-dependent peptidase ImmA (M78 family)